MKMCTAFCIAISVLFMCNYAIGGECAPASIFVSGAIGVRTGECNEQRAPVSGVRIILFLDDREVNSHIEAPTDSCITDQDGRFNCEVWFDPMNGNKEVHDPELNITYKLPKCDGKVQRVEAILYKEEMISKRIIVETTGKDKIDLGSISIWEEWHNKKIK